MMDRDFKGVWIPKEIWLSHDMTIQEKALLVEIDSLSKTENGCYASNDYLAEFIGLSKERTRKLIASLVAKGFVTVVMEYKDNSKEISKRWLKTTIPYGHFQPHPMVINDQEINKELLINISNKEKEILKKEKVKAPTLEEVTEYVRAKGYHFSPKDFFDYYDTANWHKADGKPVLNWKQCCVTWETKRTESRSNVTKRPIIDISDPNTYANDRDEKERLNKWD